MQLADFLLFKISVVNIKPPKSQPSMISRRFSGIILQTISNSCKIRFEAKRSFRSDAALEAIANALEEKVPNLVLYNYPSFSGAFSALFAHLYHSHIRLPCLILPFSSVVPFRLTFLSIPPDFNRFWVNRRNLKTFFLQSWRSVFGWVRQVLSARFYCS